METGPISFATPVTGLSRPNTGKEDDDDDDHEVDYMCVFLCVLYMTAFMNLSAYTEWTQAGAECLSGLLERSFGAENVNKYFTYSPAFQSYKDFTLVSLFTKWKWLVLT
jgi:hypothetical protein